MKTARAALEVSWSAIAKVLIALALVWVWMQLWHFVMVLIVSIIVAALCAVMIAASWVTIRNESRLIVQRLTELSLQMRTSFPLIEQILPEPGAILALPIAAIYPCIERIWLRERLTGDTVDIHKRLSA